MGIKEYLNKRNLNDESTTKDMDLEIYDRIRSI